jgi:hypothetical protein
MRITPKRRVLLVWWAVSALLAVAALAFALR